MHVMTSYATTYSGIVEPSNRWSLGDLRNQHSWTCLRVIPKVKTLQDEKGNYLILLQYMKLSLMDMLKFSLKMSNNGITCNNYLSMHNHRKLLMVIKI